MTRQPFTVAAQGADGANNPVRERAPIRQKKTRERPVAISMRRVGGMLAPFASMDAEAIAELDSGAELLVEITQRRHAGRLRLHWAILKILADNLPIRMSPQTLHGAVKLKLGVSTVVRLPGGDVIVPGSIAFDSMKEPEFKAFLERFLDLAEEFIPGIDRRRLEHEGRQSAGLPT